MAIKRIIYEMDDQAHLSSPTDIPDELKTEQVAATNEQKQTGDASLHEEEKIEQESSAPTKSSKIKFGRTIYDFFMEIKEDRRCTILFFIIVPFAMLALKSVDLGFKKYFAYSLLMGFIFIIIWFILGAVFKKDP